MLVPVNYDAARTDPTPVIPDTSSTAKDAVKLLLVEDDPADAALVEEMLASECADEFHITHVDCLAAALEKLDHGGYSVVLLDLSLPDEFGTPTLKRALPHARGVPVIVFTGFDSDRLGEESVAGGAQDYVVKGGDSQALVRAIRHAIRRNSIQLQTERSYARKVEQLQCSLEHQKQLLALAGLRTEAASSAASLLDRHPGTFETLQTEYGELLDAHLDAMATGKPLQGNRIAVLAKTLGDHRSGSRDVIELHFRAASAKNRQDLSPRSKAYLPEGRLLALEVMGALADYYLHNGGEGIESPGIESEGDRARNRGGVAEDDAAGSIDKERIWRKSRSES